MKTLGATFPNGVTVPNDATAQRSHSDPGRHCCLRSHYATLGQLNSMEPLDPDPMEPVEPIESLELDSMEPLDPREPLDPMKPIDPTEPLTSQSHNSARPRGATRPHVPWVTGSYETTRFRELTGFQGMDPLVIRPHIVQSIWDFAGKSLGTS